MEEGVQIYIYIKDTGQEIQAKENKNRRRMSVGESLFADMRRVIR